MKLSLTIDGRRRHDRDSLARAGLPLSTRRCPAARRQCGESRARRVFGAAGWPQLRRVRRRHAGGLVVTIEGYRFELEVRDPRRWSRKSAGGGAGAVQSIVSPMPGKVVRVLVAPGDEVVAGQGIVVVEAMKMQNELKSNRTGRVLSVAAKEGATVNAGELLATIE